MRQIKVLDNQFEGLSDNISPEFPLSSLDKDTIGEILNISMGTAATTISTLLDKRVIITTPVVSIIKINDLEINSLEPAIGIQIEYIEGLSGSNIMIMKVSDIKEMVKILLSSSGQDEIDDELDDMQISIIGEIMNQMMGSSCTALASFLEKNINISTPKTFMVDEIQSVFSRLNTDEYIVVVKFCLYVGDTINSEFITVLPIQFANELINIAFNIKEQANINNSTKAKETTESEDDNETKIEKVESEEIDEINQSKDIKEIKEKPIISEKDEISSSNKKKSPKSHENNIPNKKLSENTQNEKSSQVVAQPLKFNSFDDDEDAEDDYFGSKFDSNNSNFNLLLNVPLEVTVEIGRKKQPIKEILEIRQGSIIELDKQACDPVDIMVNGQLIAKGDVVVIDENFGVRITEIISGNELVNKFNK